LNPAATARSFSFSEIPSTSFHAANIWRAKQVRLRHVHHRAQILDALLGERVAFLGEGRLDRFRRGR
jgi:hypothetical protein